MDIPFHNSPYLGPPEDIVCEERRLTGKTRLVYRWHRERVEFEVQVIATVDASSRYGPTDIRQHVQRIDWIRA